MHKQEMHYSNHISIIWHDIRSRVLQTKRVSIPFVLKVRCIITSIIYILEIISLCSSNYTSAIQNRKYRIGSIVSIVRIKTWYFTDVVFRMIDIFDAVLVYSLNCCQTFILYGDVLVKADMILYMIFFFSHSYCLPES